MEKFKAVNLVRLAAAAFAAVTIIVPFAAIEGASESKPFYDVFGVGSNLNQWLEKNSGLRKQAARYVSFRFFGISPSDSLHVAKDGSMIYSLDHNLDIAKGTYPLNQAMLNTQAEIISNLKKYYDLLGADLYFMSYPANTSIYPECIRGGNYTVGESPSDIVINNLLSRTDVNALTPKWELVEAKKLGRTYLKLDGHASDLGAYVTYKKICEVMSEKSGIDMTPIDVQFVDGEYDINLSEFVGVPGLFPDTETAPVAVYDAKAREVKSGEFYEQLESILKKERYPGDTGVRAVFENPDAPNGTLLIDGTSQFLFDNIGEKFQLTRYLAENFKRVVLFGNGLNLMPEMDNFINPDIVLVESPERYSISAGIRETGNIPTIASGGEVAKIPITPYPNNIATGGLWLDYFGDMREKGDDLAKGASPIPLGDINNAVIGGWALDANTQLPLSAIYVKLGDNYFKCTYGRPREDVPKKYGFTPEAANVGFRIELPRKFFEGATQIEFILVGTDGTYRYEPVVFELT